MKDTKVTIKAGIKAVLTVYSLHLRAKVRINNAMNDMKT